MPYLAGYMTPQDYGAAGNGSTDDTAAFAAAISAAGSGTLFVPPGTYLIGSGPLTLSTSGLRITGTGPDAVTLKTTANGLFSLSGTARDIEIDHLGLDVTGGDVFAGSNVGRCHFHHLGITQRSAGFAVWNGAGMTSCIENLWEKITYTLTATSRTVPAWNYTSTASDAINGNVWRGIVANNSGPDTAQYQWVLQCNGAGNTFQSNALRDITFENPLGGQVHVLSGQKTIMENLHCWDLTANVSAPLISIGTDGTSLVGPAGTVIRDCGRSFGPLTGSGTSQDITLDGSTTQTLIENYNQFAATPKTFINLNGSDGTTILNPPANLTLSGTSGATWTLPGADGIPLPADQGLIAWAYDPAGATSNLAPTAGTVQLIKVIIRTATTITNVIAAIAATGTLTSGENFAGLYNSAGTLLSATTDQTTNWGTTGVKVMALSAPQAVQPGAYYVALLANGTPCTFSRSTSGTPANTALNTGLAAAASRWATGPVTQTALPASITMTSNTQSGNAYWVAVS